jgi:tetratricopeptide (TPR) repeat protein/Mrp family chromosome partitioning ATPase
MAVLNRPARTPIGKIITFYSFKGGSGRSMSLANLAVLFAKQAGGRKVLMIDWDLEAPGLQEFFKPKLEENDINGRKGVIDLFVAARTAWAQLDESAESELRAFEFIEAFFDKHLLQINIQDPLELLIAGQQGPDYAPTVQTFDWRGFFESHYVFFKAFIQFLKSRWDYILIDSRTGLTDTGGICTAILPEVLVTVFTPTNQGLRVTDMIERALTYRKGADDMRPLVVYPLVSRVDSSEEDSNRAWKARFTPMFEGLFQRHYGLDKCDLKRYFGKVEIHYVRKFAYGEQVSVLGEYSLDDKFSLPARYNELAQTIMGDYRPWEIPDLPDIPMTDANRVGYYAVELQNNGEYKRAEAYYQKAIEMKPDADAHLNNYALFLQDIKKDYDKAEQYYLRAIEIDSNHVINVGSYALFLETIKKDYDKAEQYYLRAIEIDSNHANNVGNYAAFLQDIRQDYDKAEQYYLRAIEIDNNHANNVGNYANFLQNIKKDYEQAEQYYLKAIEIDSNNAINLGNYASFLHAIKKDYEQAEQYYLRAIEIDNNYANNVGNYASFLHTIKKDYDKAEQYYLRAIEIDNNHAINVGNYAFFLSHIKKDYDKAEQYYLRAIEIDNNYANNVGNYASFLQDIKKDYEKAEHYYLRAIEIEPKNADFLGNYSQLLFRTKRADRAAEYLDRAFDIKPDKPSLLVEIWYYRYAYQAKWREEAAEKLERLLAEGARSPGWSLDQDADIAIKEYNHPDPDNLKRLAKALTTE